jgi:hypothetical protein
MEPRISSLESAKLKVARASVHLDGINELVRGAVSEADTYKITKDADGEEHVNFLIGPPRDVLVLIGEVVYQLRSALDHLAFHLVESNPTNNALREKKHWERNIHFPLILSLPTYGYPPTPYTIPVPKKIFLESIPGLTDRVYEFIESLQPYRDGPGIHNSLRILAELANIDRHRHLHVILPRVSVHHEISYSNGMTGVSTVGGLKHGAKIPIPDEIPFNAGVYENRSFSPYITFDETIGTGPDTLASENVLDVILRQIETVIIPKCEQLVTC